MSILRKDVNKILLKIQKGDEKSKQVLYEMTYNHLKIVAYSCVRNKDNLEDVLSTTYLRVYTYIYSFDPRQDGYNWMCTILKNVANDMERHAFDYVPLEDCEAKLITTDLEERVAEKDEVERFLQGYGERDREMVRSRFFKNRGYRQIAEEFGMKKSNVHKRVTKILKEIQEKNQK